MKVRHLIAQLKQCPQNIEVVCFVSWDGRSIPINSVISKQSDDHVVLSDRFPRQKAARGHEL